MNARFGHKGPTNEELDAAVRASKGQPGSLTVWIHDRLLEEARTEWEEITSSDSTTGDGGASA
jgi:hypothetical protein